MLRNHTAWILGAALLGACAVDDTSEGSQNEDFSREPNDSVVLTLNQQAIAAIGNAAPFAATRFMAVVHIAVFEAVNACTHDFTPYFGTSCAHGGDPEAAAIVAGHDTLVFLFPAQQSTLDQQQTDALSHVRNGRSKDDGIAAGHAAAQAMIAQRTNDGSAPPQFFLPPNTNPGMWQLTPSCPPAGGVFKQWPNVRPFGVQSSSQFRAGPPPSLTSSQYAHDYNETQSVGDINSPNRPQSRSDVAKIYAA
jgi:hypothetical protein